MPRFTVVMAVVAYEEGVEDKVPYRISFHIDAPTRYDAVNHLAQSIRKVADASVFEPRVPSASVAEVNPVAATLVAANAAVAGLNEKENEILRKRFEKMPEAMSMGWMFTKPKDSDCHNCGGDSYTMNESKCPACKGTGKETGQQWSPPDAGSDDEEEDK
ncbi:MAG: hypothetical protein WC565_03975 [Parcubacteria group bacterium]